MVQMVAEMQLHSMANKFALSSSVSIFSHTLSLSLSRPLAPSLSPSLSLSILENFQLFSCKRTKQQSFDKHE